jgi:folate-binding Fe-S cluster repair protein YgfZ
MHQQVHELATEGKTQAEIISRLHLHRHTVRKYLRMPTFVAHYCSPHPSPVEPYRAYLEERWQQGEVMSKTRLPRITRARLYRQLHKCVDLRAQLAPSGRNDPHVFFFLCGCFDS